MTTKQRAPQSTTGAVGVSPDIGDLTAAGDDAFAFLERQHARVRTLRISDRKKNGGAQVACGQGDAPLRAVLTLVREREWQIPAIIRVAGTRTDAFGEVRRCLEHCRTLVG
jgi:sugar phosphate isomerase/epimerase